MKKKITALFMICMIVALPVYSASVFAGISNVGVFGEDGLKGYRKGYDFTYVNATVAVDGDDDITPDEQVFFNNIPFNTCRRLSNETFMCFLGIKKETLDAKTYLFNITLKDDSENVVGIYANTFVVDNKGPTIESFSINPKVTRKGDLTVKYSVKDYAYGTSMGPGLSKIIICKNYISTVIKEIKINDSSRIDSGELQFKTSDFVSETGSANVCIAAYDKLNQVSEFRCEKLTVDENVPEIKEDSFKIVDYNGNEIDYLSGKPLRVIISIDVEDESLDKVVADLSELNKDEPSYKNKVASCVSKNGASLCTWPSILIKINNPGKVNIKINATDATGNTAEESVEVNVDETAPKINKDSFKLTDINGDEINYLTKEPLTAVISIEVEDESLDNVVADLSELNKDEPSYKNKMASCVSKNGASLCTWSGIVIKLNSSGKVNIKVNAADYIGNTAEESLSYDFKVDNTAPVVKSLKNSDGKYNNIKYIGKNNEFIAEIEEKDSGFNLKKIWLLVEGEKIQADGCSESGGDWKCKFDNIGFNAADGSLITIFISPSSEDDAGNNVDINNGIISEEFKLDIKAPVLTRDIEIKILNINRSYSQDDILLGDKLHIKAILSERTSITASADLSGIGLGSDESTQCTKNESNWVCEWTTNKIAPKSTNVELKFKFTDFVGNEAEKKVNIKVLGISDEENPNYWKVSSIEKMPEAIDRQTTELINQKTYYHIKLKPASIYENPTILALDLQCNGDMDYIENSELINKNFNDPYIILTLKQESMPNVSLSFNCNLFIISRVGDLIIQNTEEEPVDLTIKFYNMPLGELSQNVKDKIKDAQDSWLVKQEWLDFAEKLLNLAEKICKLIQTFGKINEAIADIELLASAFEWTGFVETIHPIAETTDKTYKQILEYTDKYCKYVSCDTTIWGGWYDEFSSKNTPEIFKEMRFGNAFWPSSPKESIVLSLATGCIPGIIHNLQKRRQIECYYILCLKKAADEGIPLSVCDEQKAYLECMFIYGEIFQVIPFAGFFKGLTEQFSMIVSDPLGLIFGGLNFYCELQPTMAGHAICVAGHLVPTLASITQDIIGFADTDTWWISGDVCEEALKPMPETTEDEGEDTEETDEEGNGEEE